MPNEMTFQQEGDYIVCYIDGVEVSRAKKAADGTSTAEVIDIINDQIKANPTLVGTEPNLEGLEVGDNKYAVPAQIPVVANPTLAGTEADLTGLEVDGTKYKVPSGGGGGSEVHLYRHNLLISGNTGNIYWQFCPIFIETTSSVPITIDDLQPVGVLVDYQKISMGTNNSNTNIGVLTGYVSQGEPKLRVSIPGGSTTLMSNVSITDTVTEV